MRGNQKRERGGRQRREDEKDKYTVPVCCLHTQKQTGVGNSVHILHGQEHKDLIYHLLPPRVTLAGSWNPRLEPGVESRYSMQASHLGSSQT